MLSSPLIRMSPYAAARSDGARMPSLLSFSRRAAPSWRAPHRDTSELERDQVVRPCSSRAATAASSIMRDRRRLRVGAAAITANTERGQLSLCCGSAILTSQFGIDGRTGDARCPPRGSCSSRCAAASAGPSSRVAASVGVALGVGLADGLDDVGDDALQLRLGDGRRLQARCSRHRRRRSRGGRVAAARGARAASIPTAAACRRG